MNDLQAFKLISAFLIIVSVCSWYYLLATPGDQILVAVIAGLSGGAGVAIAIAFLIAKWNYG